MENNLYKTCTGQYCLPNDYDQKEPPRKDASSGPVEVKLEFNNVEVLRVDDIDFTVHLKMHLGIHWKEPRIIVLNGSSETKTPLDLKLLDHLWVPDLEILNLRDIREYSILKKLAGEGICITSVCSNFTDTQTIPLLCTAEFY